MPSSPRPRRIAPQGARARVANADADVVNVSRTGVLIRAPYPLRTGTEWPLTLEISHTPLLLTGRVVRCEPMADPSARRVGPVHHRLALRFLSMSQDSQTRLYAACGGQVERPTLPARLFPLHPVSIARRCPRCGATHVEKQRRHHYYCDSCQRGFVGVKLGPLRLAF